MFCLNLIICIPFCGKSNTLELVDFYEPSSSLFREAFGRSSQIGHPVYDSLYLVLARRNNAILLTLDTKLADACRTLSIKTVA
ncbi:MAG: type II toxin-antitoxin system VapC family toxin [Candidatus Aminicenantes bacterium]|nr:type II toxin-antitoxin system VapC family toxin [Candidatus Aminicenantes bacterium]